jgi:RNA polymerase primary sigma factor
MAIGIPPDKRAWRAPEVTQAEGPEETRIYEPEVAGGFHPETRGEDRNLVIDVTSLHLLDIGEVPLLTHQEEIDLSKRIELGQKAQTQLVAANHSADILQMDQEIADGLAARKTLWESNCRLVISVAKKYVGHGLPIDDLIEEGHLGLERAVTRFDWRRGFKFSTYATWWIRQAITRALSNQARTIRIPVHALEYMNSISKAVEAMRQESGTEPDVKQIAEYMQMPVDKIAEVFRTFRTPMSLDALSGTYDDTTLSELIPGEDNIADTFDQINLSHEVKNDLLNKLSSRQRMVISLRYGFLNGREHTLAEIGSIIGVSRERVRQIQSEALLKLRHEGEINTFTDYL